MAGRPLPRETTMLFQIQATRACFFFFAIRARAQKRNKSFSMSENGNLKLQESYGREIDVTKSATNRANKLAPIRKDLGFLLDNCTPARSDECLTCRVGELTFTQRYIHAHDENLDVPIRANAIINRDLNLAIRETTKNSVYYRDATLISRQPIFVAQWRTSSTDRQWIGRMR